MPFDEKTADRLRAALKRRAGITEKKMFGGLCFLHRGNMLCGVQGDRLVLRLGEERVGRALEQAHTSPMDFTGRVMKSMIYVDPAGFESDRALKAWMKSALDFAKSLPPK